MASRSAVMPSFVTLPFIQCHHVCGFASCGGLRKDSRDNPADGAADDGAAISTAKAAKNAVFMKSRLFMLNTIDSSIALSVF